MGPFVPNIFSGELNYIIAILIGIAFGYVLENAGFSSSRRLAGLFYGYDFVVLKVFFTAAIVAIFGIVLLNYFGLLNLELIYVNPLFVPSAIIGGVIMGVGFIIGGFCPGTSICASVIGKIDAMFFVLGSLLGIFIFNLAYPVIESVYKAGAMGSILVFDSIGISRGLFIFLLTIIALFAFAFVTKLEARVNGLNEHPEKPFFKNYYLAIGFAIVISFLLIFTPDWKTKVFNNANEKVSENEKVDFMTADEVAFKLIHGYNDFQLIDLRNPEKFKKDNIPTSINIPFKEILNTEWYDYIKTNPKALVFYSDNNDDAMKAYFIAKEFGHSYNQVLDKGFDYFDKIIMHPYENVPDTSSSILGKFAFRFRTNAKIKLLELKKKAAKKNKPIKKKVVKIQGGCS